MHLPSVMGRHPFEDVIKPTFLFNMMIFFHDQVLLIKTPEEEALDSALHLPHLELNANQRVPLQIRDYEDFFFQAPLPVPKVIIPPFCTRIVGRKNDPATPSLPKITDLVIFTQFYRERSIVFWENLLIRLSTLHNDLSFTFVDPNNPSSVKGIPQYWHLYLVKAAEFFKKHYPSSPSNPYEIDMETAYREDYLEAFLKSTSRKHFKELELSSFIDRPNLATRSLTLPNLSESLDVEEDIEDLEYAGIFLVTVSNHVLLLQSREHSSMPHAFMPPKGQQEPGERLLETALRELHEETRIGESDIEIVKILPTCTYYVQKPRFQKKKVVFFLAILIKPLAIFLSPEHQNFIYVSKWHLRLYVRNNHLLQTFCKYQDEATACLMTYPKYLDQSY